MPVLSYPSRAIAWGQVVNWDHPLNRGLVSWKLCGGPWKGATWYDLCGRNHGTLTSMDPPTDWVAGAGRPGGLGSLDFDGTNDYVVNSALNPTLPGDFTAMCWLRSTSGTASRFIDVAQAAGVGMQLVYQTTSISIDNSGGPTSNVTWSTAANDGAWRHVAVTRSGTTYTLYGDGSSRGTPSGGTAPTYTRVFVATRANLIGSFAGQIDDVRVFNRAWSGAELWQGYNDSRQGYPGTLNRVTSTRRLFNSAGGGGGGGSIPPKVYNYRAQGAA